MKEIKNIRELTADLGRVYAELRAREIEIKEASEIANIAGKIINGAKAEMMYRIARKEKPSIPFFRCRWQIILQIRNEVVYLQLQTDAISINKVHS